MCIIREIRGKFQYMLILTELLLSIKKFAVCKFQRKIHKMYKRLTIASTLIYLTTLKN